MPLLVLSFIEGKMYVLTAIEIRGILVVRGNQA